MISGPTLRPIGLAIAGILVAAAVAVAASQSGSRQIGLASGPVSAGDRTEATMRTTEAGDDATVSWWR